MKVLNSGLGPFKDQTAEMVLFGPFLTQVLFFIFCPQKSSKALERVLFWSFFLLKSPFFSIEKFLTSSP